MVEANGEILTNERLEESNLYFGDIFSIKEYYL